ncbi:unnamed protein product [Meloidogyne enterolobii]|uniref:Uncharacterized protein n=1 Tax=Meloidogyne enterolobii TaxID=390850 RepID=A0ACB0ZPX4_MELEN
MKLKCQRGHKENKNEYGKGEGEDEEEEEEEENEDEEISKDLSNFEISIIKSEQSSFTQSQSDTELLEEEEEKNEEDEEKVEIFIKKALKVLIKLQYNKEKLC